MRQEHPKIEVTFLGTGTSTGVPVIGCNCPVCVSTYHKDKRLRTSVLIEIAGKKIVVDTGPDFRQQLLSAGTDNVDAVLLTHSHRDHIAGLDDIRAINYVHNKRIPIYGSQKTIEDVNNCFPYLSGQHFFGSPQVDFNIIQDECFNIDEIPILPVKVLHNTMEVFGFRIYDFTYITDANFISSEELEKIKGSKTIVINALRKSRHNAHFSLSEAQEILVKLKPENAYLTHISHFLGLHNEVQGMLPDFIHLAWDGLKLIC